MTSQEVQSKIRQLSRSSCSTLHRRQSCPGTSCLRSTETDGSNSLACTSSPARLSWRPEFQADCQRYHCCEASAECCTGNGGNDAVDAAAVVVVGIGDGSGGGDDWKHEELVLQPDRSCGSRLDVVAAAAVGGDEGFYSQATRCCCLACPERLWQKGCTWSWGQ